MMLALRLPGSRDLRLISAMGGQCGPTFAHDNDAESSSWPEATPTQVALDRLPAEARVRRPEPDPMEELRRPATLDEACVLQEIMFGKAWRARCPGERVGDPAVQPSSRPKVHSAPSSQGPRRGQNR